MPDVAMLEVLGLEAAYGDSQVLFGVDLAVHAGEVVTLLGRNGMGKTTTVLSIMGLVKPRAGQVIIERVLANLWIYRARFEFTGVLRGITAFMPCFAVTGSAGGAVVLTRQRNHTRNENLNTQTVCMATRNV